MIALRVSNDEARSALRGVPHETFQNATNHNWKVDDDGTVDGCSVCWLYCWAKTGMGSPKAAAAAERVFDEVLSSSFDRFDAAVDHEWARWARYASDRRAVEAELARLLE